jgi:hypothetical protein
MFNHYREALKTIKDNMAELAVVNPRLGLCSADYERFLVEERTYLHGLRKEPEEDIFQFEYVAALEDESRLKYVPYYIIFFKLLMYVAGQPLPKHTKYMV